MAAKDEKLTLAVLAKRIHALEEGSNPKGPLAGTVAALARRLVAVEQKAEDTLTGHAKRLEKLEQLDNRAEFDGHAQSIMRNTDRIEALEKHSLGLGDHQIKFGDSCLKLEKRIDLLSADVCALDDDADAQFLWVDRIESRLDSVASQTENGNRKRKKLASRVRALEEWAYSEDMQSECNAYGTGSVEESGCPSCCCDDAPDLSAPEWRAAFDEAVCEAYGSDAYAQRDPGDETDKPDATIRVGDIVECLYPDKYFPPMWKGKKFRVDGHSYIDWDKPEISLEGWIAWWPAKDFRKVEAKPEPMVPRRERCNDFWDKLSEAYVAAVEAGRVPTPWGFH